MDIKAVSAQIDADIQEINSLEALEQFRLKYLGRKGLVAELTSAIPGLPQEERARFGQEVNALKNKLLSLIAEKQKTLAGSSGQAAQAAGDLGMPGISQSLGQLHPLTQVTDEICAIFNRMGFSIVEGPEIESEYNNFTGLNIPLEHPSREAFDTFYLKNYTKMLLRSHTSPVQVRQMKEQKPPLAIVVPGRVYRPDAVDAAHSFMFHQIEGFMVDTGIKFSDLKGILEMFAQAVFGNDIKMRFRPHFFPFTEPSAEVDISCIICKGKGCSVCGRKGWLEILGSGMIHPNVFKHVGIDADKYTGFAFGLGIERIAMLKYGINDIRLFFENDLRFLRQF
ncbi:MAG: phenylalanine--tRNA ligase subunit alpha [Candidatus Omnitrophota bacterium]|jgi:phenylalanyl-tRNA synthetase alpha chain|nr:phenylalanine--tRNA ligase subunit alpha [Candidatus Omnitrophota bacterium]MDD5517793.1 phenylalanine--tRNA ligase subunit alpha [Candidatus Omnitrophota bacterium]